MHRQPSSTGLSTVEPVPHTRLFLQNLHFGRLNRPRVIVGVHSREQDNARRFIQGLHQVLGVLVNIDSSRVSLSHCLRRIHRADQRTILGINQLIGTTAGGTQIHQIRGRLRVRPIPAVRPAAQIILLHQPVKQSLSMLAEQGKLLGT